MNIFILSELTSSGVAMPTMANTDREELENYRRILDSGGWATLVTELTLQNGKEIK